MKRMTNYGTVLAVLFAVGLWAGPATAATYTFTTLNDPLGVDGTIATGIDGNNIVGGYRDATGTMHGFLYNGSTYTTLDAPSSTFFGTDVEGIWAIISSGRSGAGSFLYNGSTYTTLSDPLGPNNTDARGIDGNNIVGYYYDAGLVSHGFLYNGSTWTTIDDPLSTQGTFLIGISGSNILGETASRTFIYNGSTFTTLPGDPLGVNGTRIAGIGGNNIVGYYLDAADNPHGYLYNGSTYTTIDDPLAPESGALGTYLDGISGTTVVGWYKDSSGNEHGFVATIPEASSLTLLGSALLGLAGAVYLRRRRAKA